MNLSEAATRQGQVEFLDPERPADRAAWLDLWGSWPDREIMAHPDYVRLFARPADRVVAATFRRPSGGILYPVILRGLSQEPWGSRGEGACDMTTAYGYGGPFGWNVTEEETRLFWVQFDAWARSEGVVTSFARLSLFAQALLPFNGTVEVRSTNIVRRLDLPEEQIWADYTHKVRQNVQHARKLGITVEVDTTGRRLEEFHQIYISTMQRRGASPEYYHPLSFFESIVRDLAGHFVLFHALFQGRVISTELVLLSEEHAYSLFGGSIPEAFRLRGTDLLKHEIILWCRAAGKKALILGGGVHGTDGIFRFKKSFAPRGEVAFRVGKRVYDAALSAQLVEERRRYEEERGNDWQPVPQYFPEYRA